MTGTIRAAFTFAALIAACVLLYSAGPETTGQAEQIARGW